MQRSFQLSRKGFDLKAFRQEVLSIKSIKITSQQVLAKASQSEVRPNKQ